MHWQCFPDTEEGQALYAKHYKSDAERYGEYPWADEDNVYPARVLVECCGTQRPRSKDATLQVKAVGAFLTVHDYVSQVHPWLMDMRERLLEALGWLNGRAGPWAPETKLLVDEMYFLMIIEEEDLVTRRPKPFVPPPGYVPLSHEEGSLESLERSIAKVKARMREQEAAAAAAAEQAAEKAVAYTQRSALGVTEPVNSRDRKSVV